MIAMFAALALKSLLVAGVTLTLLRATRRRSAAERSLIAHLGLFAMAALPLASLTLPVLRVSPPAFVPLPRQDAVPAAITIPASSAPSVAEPAPSIDWTPYAYAAPAVALLLVTLLALLRLGALSRRAEVLVEPVWLSALAHAQRRMGLKNGTALLVSDTLPSPVSWGWARPVIVLNRDALSATRDAEAIIAHELAHVVSLDWAKLMLARIATALFWFNPLAWVLAREAHQLREEAADDAVLATAIPGADYAQLLVGVARHEARGLLLGAHGVAPGKGSLRRRVGRVLDASLPRGPARGSWVAAFGAGMLVMAAPLAALTLAREPAVPRGAADVSPSFRPEREPSGAADIRPVPLPIADPGTPRRNDARSVRPRGGRPAMPVDGDALVALKAAGVTADYAAAIESAGPWLGRVSANDLAGMSAIGVTPAFVRGFAAAGLRPGSADLISARAVGLTGAYAASMRRAGYRGGMSKLIGMHAVGVTAEDLRGRAGTSTEADEDDDPDENSQPG